MRSALLPVALVLTLVVSLPAASAGAPAWTIAVPTLDPQQGTQACDGNRSEPWDCLAGWIGSSPIFGWALGPAAQAVADHVTSACKFGLRACSTATTVFQEYAHHGVDQVLASATCATDIKGSLLRCIPRETSVCIPQVKTCL
jgi:hypothetical protein